MRMRPVYLWSARGKEAAIMRISSDILPGVPRIFLSAPPSSATLALPHDQGAQHLDA
jgi:hypothetical protein